MQKMRQRQASSDLVGSLRVLFKESRGEHVSFLEEISLDVFADTGFPSKACFKLFARFTTISWQQNELKAVDSSLEPAVFLLLLSTTSPPHMKV